MLDNISNGFDSVLYSLRSLFSGYGYSEYKMTKFEEYDLYVRNKDFLISENVITFTDTNGKLLALKPDVTLSIVKNTKIEDSIQKVFYNENVYRVSSKSNGYKEIAQIGLECIGDIDAYNVAEILTLAAESLKIISNDFILDVSPIGLISALIENLNLDSALKKTVFKCVNEKNVHELKQILTAAEVDFDDIKRLCSVLEVYGKMNIVIPQLKQIFAGTNLLAMVNEFENALSILPENVKNTIYIDCSSSKKDKYYNFIAFKGYINGIPKEILSGGRYDGLLKRMGKDCKAIGFAIYPDEFDRIFSIKKQYDIDVVVLYSEKSSLTEVLSTVNALYKEGKTAMAVKKIPSKLVYKDKIEL